MNFIEQLREAESIIQIELEKKNNNGNNDEDDSRVIMWESQPQKKHSNIENPKISNEFFYDAEGYVDFVKSMEFENAVEKEIERIEKLEHQKKVSKYAKSILDTPTKHNDDMER